MIVEIRTYRLKPGTREEFVRVMREESLPLLTKYGIDVVDCGSSLVDDDCYLIRAFESLTAHKEQEDRFYSSDEWLNGPREAIVSRIESYHTVVLDLPAQAVHAMRG